MKQAPIIPTLKFQNATLPFSVQTIKEFTEQQDDVIEGPHSHNYFELTWLVRGKGTLLVDMQQYEIEDSTVIGLKPGEPHQFQTDTKMDGFVFSFTDSFFKMDEYDFGWTSQRSLCQLFSGDRTIMVTADMESDMKEIASKMMKEFEGEGIHKMELLKRYFKIFLIYLSRGLEQNIIATENSRKKELVRGFMGLLDKNFREKKAVSEYAGELLVTANYLNRIVKQHTGFSAGHHIRQRVISEAKRMGRFSDAGMKEIAYNLGFLDTAHFSRFFKSFGGMNFSDFKKEAIVVPLNRTFNRA